MERWKFNTIFRDYIENIVPNCENGLIDITDYNVNNEDLLLLENIKQKDNVLITDKSWFGGVWSLNDFLMAEQNLNKFI